jgi:hypothetical protein
MSAVDDFGRTLAELWTRDGIVVDDAQALGDAVASTFVRDPAAAAALMDRAGVRAEWNRVLREDRARALAARIQPLVAEPLLDLLSGDGSVCEALAASGIGSMSATERSGEYPEWRLPPDVRFEPFTDRLDLSRFNASTVLVSAVLHHEPDPARLLDTLAAARIPRWIVVENCVTPAFTRPFHQLVDRFFNTCLNDFGVHCGEEHRTLEEWAALLGRYGDVTIEADYFAIPGIPFPYSTLVVQTATGRPR